MISSDEHYLPEVNALTGEHSYIIDTEGWAIAHARHFYIAGFDQDGNLVPAISKDLFAEQQKSGYLPANLNAMGFIDANFPLICEYNRQGKSGSVPIYFWRDATFPQGRARALAFATIPYFTGRYNSPAGFGWVGVTSDADKFHEPADLVGGKIDQARRGLQTNTLLILALTVLAILGIAGLLARTITNPVRRLTNAAQAIESGERFEPERIASITGSGDELGHLARVFSRMALEVQAREERLKKQVEQLRIEVDEVKKARQVAEITETDYFRELRQHAAEMRKKAKGE
jgi:methyl-accepting chemotaxis protein